MKTNVKIALIIGAVAAVAACLTVLLMIPMEPSLNSLKLAPMKPAPKQEVLSPDKEIGTGWSAAQDPRVAVKEALTMALDGKKSQHPDFVVLFATSGTDMNVVLSSIREVVGKNAKIYGGTSDSRGLMTDKGYISAAEQGYDYRAAGLKHALAVMTVASKDILFGIGSPDCSKYPSAQHCSKAALLKALESAGKPENEPPNLVLITSPRSFEEQALDGIHSVLGQRTPVIGGTAGGPVFGSIGEDEVYGEGISLAVIYTKLPLGWVFEGGFEVEDRHSGIVIQVDGQAIVKIDHRPALEVYDEWLAGHISRLFEENRDYSQIRALLNLHPLYRKYRSPDGTWYFLFSHPWPKDKTLREKVVLTATKFKEGERVYLSHGSWETFLNRIGKLPAEAKKRGGIATSAKPLFGIGYICSGVMGAIPSTEREKMASLINHMNNGAPFIAPFTWGEQGYFPGIGNKHGNLLTSFVVVGGKE